MSDHEWFAQVAHDKWANEQIAPFSERIAHSLTKNEQFAQTKIVSFFVKRSDSLIPSFWMSDVSKSLRLLTKKMSDHEWFAQVAYQKWANKQIARFLSKLLIFHFFPKANSEIFLTV